MVAHDLKRNLETIHTITGTLNMPLAQRLVALIIYANTFDKVEHCTFPKLSLICISLACKIQEICCRTEKIIEHCNAHFNSFDIKKEEIARIEVDVARSIGFEFEIAPASLVYFRLVRTCKAQVSLSRLRMMESIHLDSRILRLKYFAQGEFAPHDVALAIMDDRHIREMCEAQGLFADFCAIDRIRSVFFDA